MTPRLEDDLAAGMHEHVAAVHLTRDVLAAARRRHRRRATVTRAVSATGTLGVAGAVAAAVAVHGPASSRAPSGPPAVASSSSASPSGPVTLDAATVSARVAQALTDTDEQVMHVRMRATLGGETSGNELWHDPVTNDMRATGPKAPGNPRMDVAVEYRGETQVTTVIDHENRRWWRDTDRVVEAPGDGARGKPLGGLTPDELREDLRRGTWTLVGRDRTGGRPTVHLRVTAPVGGEASDVWVDAESYVLVRRVVVSDDPQARFVADYEFLPRTDEALAQLKFRAVPRGYEKTLQPLDTSPAAPGGRG
jgi:hypothetical protein